MHTRHTSPTTREESGSIGPRALGAVLALLLAAALLGTAPAAAEEGCAQEWTGTGGDWPTAGGDLVQSNFQDQEDRIGVDSAAQLQLEWTAPSEGAIAWSPVVSGSCLYYFANTEGERGHIYAVDAGTGELEWESDRQIANGNRDDGYIYQPRTLTVDGGLVHIDSDRGRENREPTGHAFDARSGEHVWSSEPILFGYEALQFASPKVWDGMHLIFSTGPDFDPDSRPGYALLDVENDGEVLAARPIIPEELHEQGYAGGGVWLDPAIDPATGHAYAGTSNPNTYDRESAYDNAIIKIDMDRERETFGEIVGVYKGDPDSHHHALYHTPQCVHLTDGVHGVQCGQQDNDFAGGPSVFVTPEGRTLIAAVQVTGTLHVVDAETMTEAWSYTIGAGATLGRGGLGAVPAYDGERLYAVASGILYAFQPDTGEVLWVLPLQDGTAVPVFGNFSIRNPLVANGVVYTIGVQSDRIIAHDARDGSIIGVLDPSEDSGRSCAPGAGGGLAMAHHMIYINCGSYVAAYGLPG